MNRFTKRVWITIVSVVILGGLCYGGFSIYQLIQHRKTTETTEKDPLKVAVERIGTATLEKKVAVTGEIKAVSVVDVTPKVSGCLERLRLPARPAGGPDGTLIDEGTVIKADPATKTLPVIAVIEHAALDAALQQATAAMEVAKAAQERVAITLADALRDKKRIEKLFKKGVATQNELDKATIAHAQLAVGLQLAKAQVIQAAAAAKLARITLDDATITAPIAGVVTKKYVDEGNMVGPARPLVRIEQIETVKVLGGVSGRYLSALTVGKTPVEVTVDAYPDEKFTGCLCRIAKSVNPATRTGEVEIRIPNPTLRLKPGMFARIRLILQRKENVPVISDTALLRDEKGPYVFVVQESGKPTAFRRYVRLGMSQGILHEVLDGVKTGQLVVVRGQRQLHDGHIVKPVETEDGQ